MENEETKEETEKTRHFYCVLKRDRYASLCHYEITCYYAMSVNLPLIKQTKVHIISDKIFSDKISLLSYTVLCAHCL